MTTKINVVRVPRVHMESDTTRWADNNRHKEYILSDEFLKYGNRKRLIISNLAQSRYSQGLGLVLEIQ